MRSYTVAIAAVHGGQACPEDSPQTQACNEQACAGAIEHFVLPLEEDIVDIDDAEDRARFEEDFKADVATLLGVETDQVVPKARC